MGWTLLVAMKPLPQAKSRLMPATPDADGHARLVDAIRQDTLLAARSADGVARTVTVDAPGLNESLADAARDAAARWPQDGVAALVADLPALRAQDLAAALAHADGHPRGYVADAAGTGTTLLTARPGTELAPSFGPGSAARHAADAVALPAAAGLRCDVDTADDLAAAAGLGVGAATRAVLLLTTHQYPA